MNGPKPRNPLEALGEKYKPSKRWHDYLKHYWRHFQDYRESAKTVLEIGVSDGVGQRMWEEFFPNATIYGADINPECKKVEGGRVKIFIGDQGSKEFLDQIVNAMGGEADIIIDDGSHIRQHQIFGFEQLFPCVKDGGLYVVEDLAIDTEPQRMEVVNKLKGLVDHMNYWPPGVEASQWGWIRNFPESAPWLSRHVVGVAFYRYISFIMKGRNPEDNPYLPFFEG